jgi:L-aspartate oxidase
VATADGLALAVRAGAAVADLEFFQFHPTCMVKTRAGAEPDAPQDPLLISEAVRGEGAILLDAKGRRFMPGYHPDAELAPRDVVSRSIALHLAKLGDPNGHVYLDATVIEQAKGTGFLARRFPTLSARTREAGIDWTRDLVPVAPAAHYWMGGVATDLHARTSVPGLFAAGEVACTGVQGANRLASNSLLEGLVFGRRAVESFLTRGASWDTTAPRAVSAAGGLPLTHASAALSRDFAWRKAASPIAPEDVVKSGSGPEPFSRDALRRLMTAKAGVLRNGVLLREAGETLEAWAAVVGPHTVPDTGDTSTQEDANLLLAAQLLVNAARERTESLGAHYRSDCPAETAGIQEELEQTYRMRPKASLVRD